MMRLAGYIWIALLVLAAPFYGLWVLGGWLADRRGQRRTERRK